MRELTENQLHETNIEFTKAVDRATHHIDQVNELARESGTRDSALDEAYLNLEELITAGRKALAYLDRIRDHRDAVLAVQGVTA